MQFYTFSVTCALCISIKFTNVISNSFNAFQLLVKWQEGHPACKKLSIDIAVADDLIRARWKWFAHVSEFQCHHTTAIICCCSKTQNGLIQLTQIVLVYWSLNECCHCGLIKSGCHIDNIAWCCMYVQVQLPACPWEFYITNELNTRLAALRSAVDVVGLCCWCRLCSLQLSDHYVMPPPP